MDNIKGFKQNTTELSCINKKEIERKFESLSLNKMAERCLEMLNESPIKNRKYECRFSNGMFSIPWQYPLCPPNKKAFDPIALGDTDVRMLIAFPYMRKMAGIENKTETEKHLWERIESYMGEDGVCKEGTQAFSGEKVVGTWSCLWGTSHTIVAYCDEYEKTGDETLKEKAIKGIEFWIKLANKKDDALFFKYGNAPYKNGRWLNIGWAKSHRRNYPYILTALLRVYLITKDDKYLEYAKQFGNGVLRSLQKNMRELAVLEDGSFLGHLPIHTKALTGMAMLGYITGEKAYIDFAYKWYAYVVKVGTDFGWYPEALVQEGISRCETCVTGDILETQYYLTKCGYVEEYDRIERTYLNYMQSAQFVMTDEFKNMYYDLHKDKDKDLVDTNYNSMKVMKGGFVAQLSINDYVTNDDTLGATGMYQNGFQMMGCCQGAGMSGLYYIYKSLCEKENNIVKVNMSLSANTDYADIVSDYSKDYKLTITSKINSDFEVKLPSWTDYSKSVIAINGQKKELEIKENGYVAIKGINVGDKIEIDYPLIQFVQDFVPIIKDTTEKYKIYWCGNMVKKITPKGKYLSIYD